MVWILFISFLALVQQIHSTLKGHVSVPHGTVIRAAGYDAPPGMGVRFNPDGNVTFYGYTKDIMDVLFDFDNMSYVIVQVSRDEIYSKGITQSLLDQMLRNDVDFNAYGFIPTVQRIQHFDFTIPVQNDQYRFLVKYPAEESRLWGPVRPFQLHVWVLLLICIVSFNLSLSWLILKVKRLEVNGRMFNLSELIGRNAIYICNVITRQSQSVPVRTLPVRLSVAVWCLMVLILINSYAGHLISYLSIPRMTPIPNSFEEVAYKTKTGLTVEARSILADNIMNAKSGPYKAIADAIRSNPKLLFKAPGQVLEIIHDYNVPYIGMNLVVQYAIGWHLKVSGSCLLTQSKPLPLFQSLAFVLRKSSPYTNMLNSRLQYLVENGLLEKIRQNYRPNIDKCLVNFNFKRPKTTPLKLIDLSSAFLLWAIGLSLAVLAFLTEMAVVRFKRLRKSVRRWRARRTYPGRFLSLGIRTKLVGRPWKRRMSTNW